MLTTDFTNALKVITSPTNNISLALVGCGGTGSWLAPAIVRVARWLSDTGKAVDLVFIDPDRVEPKNVFRQNFCDAEIGMNKADALARRYSRAWGQAIGSRNEKFDGNRLDGYSGFGVICGCVDGPEGRAAINNLVNQYCGIWWIDSGNTASYGQVLIGREIARYGGDDPLGLPGYTTWLPTPARQHPELVDPGTNQPGQAPTQPSPSAESADGEVLHGLSCAEMALRDAQGMAINQRMAAEMADYLVRLLITKDLKKMATYIDLESGSCRSEYITKAAVEKWMK